MLPAVCLSLFFALFFAPCPCVVCSDFLWQKQPQQVYWYSCGLIQEVEEWGVFFLAKKEIFTTYEA